MCGSISTPCEADNCERFTKEVYCPQCKANINHLTGV